MSGRLFFRDSPGWTPTAKLCPACREERDRWMDTTPRIVRPGVRIAASAAHDDTFAGVRDNTRARFEQWRETVHFHIGLIEKHCAEKHLARPAPVQLDLLAELQEAS